VCSTLLLSGLVVASGVVPSSAQETTTATEAPVGFDGRTNGLVDEQTHDADRARFSRVETPSDGLGPVYNAASCAECHANPIAGGSSQVLELRAGHFDGTEFVPHPGGSLIQSRATDPAAQERILDGNEVRTFRASPSTLGLGYVEAIGDATLMDLVQFQAGCC
jgi:hypothetical protein